MTKSFSRIARTYDETRGGMDRGRRFARALAPLLPDGPVVEIGVGTGLIALGLAELGRSVLGIDVSFEMISRAHERIGPGVAVGDAHRMPVAEGSIAAAYTVWVLHLVDTDTTMREIHRVLRPGGTYLAAGPARETEPRDELERIMRGMFEELRGGPAPDRPEGVAAAAARAGLSGVGVHGGAPGSWTTSVGEVIRLIETRSYSILWDLPEERRQAVVDPALERLRALPDHDAAIPRRATDVVLEFRRD